MIAGIITTVLLTRTLGVGRYGTLALALALITVIQTLTTLGLPGGVSRMLAFARGNDDELGALRIFKASIFMGLAAGVLGVGVVLLLSALGVIDNLGISAILSVSSLLLIATGLRASLYGSLRAYQDIKALFVLALTVPLFDVVAVGVVVLSGTREIIWYALALVVAAYAEVVFMVRLVRRGRSFGSMLDTTRADAKALISFSLPFVLVQFMNLAIHQSDVVLLGAFHPHSTLGLYTPVMRLTQTVERVLQAFPLLYLPIATAYFAQRRLEDVRALYVTVTKWAYAIGFLVLLPIIVVPGIILPLLFGASYGGMVTEARILSLGYVATLLTGLNGVTLGALGLQKRAAVASLFGITGNLAIGLLLIPKFAAAGAAWSNTIAYIGVNCLFSLILYRASGVSPFRRDTTSLFLYSLVVGIVGLAAGEWLELESTIEGLGLLAGVATLWIVGASFGPPFQMEWSEIRTVFLRKNEAKKDRALRLESIRKRSEGREGTTDSSQAGDETGRAAIFPFFVGRGRSGTTLVRAMFDSHDSMAIPPESPFVVSMAYRRAFYERNGRFDVDRFLAELLTQPRFQLWELPDDLVRATITGASPTNYSDAIRALYRLYANDKGKSRFGDKSPRTTGAVERMARLFPEARFVHIIRDGRDVALSHLEVQFGPDSLVEAAIDWRREVGRCRREGFSLGRERYHEFRYEDLIDNPEAVVKEVCRFIDLEFDDGMLRYFEHADEVVKSTPTPGAHGNLFAPPTKGLRDWRSQMGDEDAATFQLLAGDLLNDLGYELSDGRISSAAHLAARWRQVCVTIPRRMRRLRNRQIGKRLLRSIGITN